MKKLLFVLIALCIVASAKSQTMKLYKDNSVIATYKTSDVDSLVCMNESGDKVINLYKNFNLVKSYKTSDVDSVMYIQELPNLLSGKFSVNKDGKQVQFTKSNLYWDGKGFKFEESPLDYPTKWDENHVGHFFWASLKDYKSGQTDFWGDDLYKPYYSNYYFSKQSGGDQFWCDESSPLTVEETSGLYVLTKSEWLYILEDRPNAKSLRKNVSVDDVYPCLIIAPDDFSGTLKDDYTLDELISNNIACFAPAGVRESKESKPKGGTFDLYGEQGYYWSSTPDGTTTAYFMFFKTGFIRWNETLPRYYGHSIRLVHTVEK